MVQHWLDVSGYHLHDPPLSLFSAEVHPQQLQLLTGVPTSQEMVLPLIANPPNFSLYHLLDWMWLLSMKIKYITRDKGFSWGSHCKDESLSEKRLFVWEQGRRSSTSEKMARSQGRWCTRGACWYLPCRRKEVWPVNTQQRQLIFRACNGSDRVLC